MESEGFNANSTEKEENNKKNQFEKWVETDFQSLEAISPEESQRYVPFLDIVGYDIEKTKIYQTSLNSITEGNSIYFDLDKQEVASLQDEEEKINGVKCLAFAVENEQNRIVSFVPENIIRLSIEDKVKDVLIDDVVIQNKESNTAYSLKSKLDDRVEIIYQTETYRPVATRKRIQIAPIGAHQKPKSYDDNSEKSWLADKSTEMIVALHEGQHTKQDPDTLTGPEKEREASAFALSEYRRAKSELGINLAPDLSTEQVIAKVESSLLNYDCFGDLSEGGYSRKPGRLQPNPGGAKKLFRRLRSFTELYKNERKRD